LDFLILLQLDESSTTTSGNRGRGRVNRRRSGGRSGGLNTPTSDGRSGGRTGGLNTPTSGGLKTPSNCGRSGGRGRGLNTPRTRAGRRGGVDTQSQHAAIPPELAPEPAIYEIESDTTTEAVIYELPSDTAPEAAIYELPSDTAPEHPSQPALNPVSQVALLTASQPAPKTPSQPTSQPSRTTHRVAAIRAATHYAYRPNVSIYYHHFFLNPKP
jgi:hypothetical protein